MWRTTLWAAIAALALSAPAFAAGPEAGKDTGRGAAVGNVYADDWRARDVLGKSVHGVNNEKIGEIKELMISPQGQVHAAIVDIGGFLGIGEHRVAMDWKDLKFSQPDGKITTSASREQLKAMPTFKFARKGKPADSGQQTGAVPADREGARTTEPALPPGGLNR